MNTRTVHGWTGAALVLALVVAMPSAQPAAADDEQQVARLEALLEAQQARLEALQDRLSAGFAQDADAARTEAMKQQIREILSEQEFRESLMPTVMLAGYDKGFYVKSSDDKFHLRINGRMQFRYTYYNQGGRNRYLMPRLRRNDRSGFDLQRTRLALRGHAFTPDLNYYVQIRADAPQRYAFTVRDAYVNYRFSDEFQIRAGVFKIAATQARLTSSKDLQFVSRSLVDAVFGLNRGLGVRFWGRCAARRVEWFLDVTNQWVSVGDRTISPDPAERDNNPAIAFRVVWHALGDDPGRDLKSEGDIEFHESPALDIAFHYAFNEDEYDRSGARIPFPLPRRLPGVGGFGLTNTNGLQVNQFGLAAAFKCHGFSARSEYILRIVDPRRAGRRPFSPWWLLTRQGDTTVQHGAYLQMGYFLPIPGLERKLEAVARVGGISTLANGQEGTWEYAAGLNYYINGNNFKLQADVTRITELPISSAPMGLANVNDQPVIFRVQLQVAF